MNKRLIAAALMGSLALPGVAFAQDSAGGAATTAPAETSEPAAASAATAATSVAVGAKVFGPQGEEVGTVESVSGETVVLNTGTNRATLAASSLGTSDKGLTIGMTKQQLDAAVQQAASQADAAMNSALVAGADVRSKDGQPVGKIETVEGDSVVLAREGGSITLSREHLTTDEQGLKLVMTKAEFEAAANAASSAAASSATNASDG